MDIIELRHANRISFKLLWLIIFKKWWIHWKLSMENFQIFLTFHKHSTEFAKISDRVRTFLIKIIQKLFEWKFWIDLPSCKWTLFVVHNTTTKKDKFHPILKGYISNIIININEYTFKFEKNFSKISLLFVS